MKKILSIIHHAVSAFLSFVLKSIIHCYRLCISPILPASCRFYPSCSRYSLEAIGRHGPFKGLYLSIHRIVRCNPLNPGGHDPVPEQFSFFRS